MHNMNFVWENNNVCVCVLCACTRMLQRLGRGHTRARVRIKHRWLNDIKSRQSHKSNIHISFCIHISLERYGWVFGLRACLCRSLFILFSLFFIETRDAKDGDRRAERAERYQNNEIGNEPQWNTGRTHVLRSLMWCLCFVGRSCITFITLPWFSVCAIESRKDTSI